MDVTRDGDRLVVRLDPGEEVIAALERLQEEHDLGFAAFTGIGAVDRATLGHYDVDTEDYKEETVEGQFEVTNFTGNLSPDKVHAHITLGRRDYTLGGHCASARVSGTFELLLVAVDEEILHRQDDRTGLDVLAL